VLLKPETDTGSQVVVQGRRRCSVRAGDYAALKPELLEAVLDSFARLRATYDLVLVEGAGSPAEVNLRKNDIANMGFARAAGVPVLLAADIDRGGVIAQVVGTQAVLDPQDAACVHGFVINRFRGDPSLFDDGYELITRRTGWRGFGVLPWFSDAWKLPAEDAQDIRPRVSDGKLHIVCLRLSRIANFDDLDPLLQEPDVRLTMLGPGQAIPGDADLVIIPGSKSTRGDLMFLREQGWDIDILAHHRRGGRVLGICGGYQMLGQSIADPDGIEGLRGETAGLGLLDAGTVMSPEKTLTRVRAIHSETGRSFSGYEIHIGRTTGPDCARPFAVIEGRPDGAVSADGLVMGSYLHGMFGDDDFRAAWLGCLGVASSGESYGTSVEQTLDGLADHMEKHLDVSGILALAR
jgi:adenosylcobyric acid synthase